MRVLVSNTPIQKPLLADIALHSFINGSLFLTTGIQVEHGKIHLSDRTIVEDGVGGWIKNYSLDSWCAVLGYKSTNIILGVGIFDSWYLDRLKDQLESILGNETVTIETERIFYTEDDKLEASLKTSIVVPSKRLTVLLSPYNYDHSEGQDIAEVGEVVTHLDGVEDPRDKKVSDTRLIMKLAQPLDPEAVKKVIEENQHRISLDPDDGNFYIRHSPGGKKERGVLDADGQFIPLPDDQQPWKDQDGTV